MTCIPEEESILIKTDMGPYIKVTAVFSGDKSCNNYLEKNPNQGVVKVVGNFVFVADKKDRGFYIDKAISARL